MSSTVATIVCLVGILGLFYLNRDGSVRTSKALWLPTMWVLINGSRPVSMWLGAAPSSASAEAQLIDGSPTDRLIYATVIALGVVVLLLRSESAAAVLKKNWFVVLYFTYCLVSLFWSDFPLVGFKRWIKAIGDVVMVTIVLTDGQPVEAIKRVITRTGFILLPASVLMIKYYGQLGRTYDVWTGEPSNCGVTVTKNMLGVLTFVLTLGAFWVFLRTLRDKNRPDRKRRLLAHLTLLTFGVSLLLMAHSATAGVCFIFGATVILVTNLDSFRVRPRAIHALVLTVLLMGGFSVLVANEAVAHAVGRQTNLTGRTDIWQMLLPMAPNPLVGAGFETFWLGPRLERIWSTYSGLSLNEAHNGYIEVYLNLGWVGVVLIALVLIIGYAKAVKSYHGAEVFGVNSLLLAYIMTAAFYNITEAGFREMDIIWVFLLLAIFGSSCALELRVKDEQREAEGLVAVRPSWRRALLSTNPRHG